ncbi:T9SS type A sorting domain-containing protein [Chitinophaga nivalis]|uniref:T9SS type A sorting domain-containing protein n=1 Tax=Chitinophaga nivalis TaxID=2991709 RepID=A0ABT3IS05_9BACT|nr:T9SS type A sorting domain-containing protein [Chitinophaga nivalis]MCW3463549.1 T9SS type A sorting domain-containing protein [Chitinophaga nivalis]MCW3486761.1 T9SS type A sorting domain-containing protein [Chitinophaga nivalis]
MRRVTAILIILLTGWISAAYAQQGVCIPAGGNVWVPGNAKVGVFSDMINNGNLGSGVNGTLYFLGKKWTNGNGATLPDESADGISGKGGLFIFDAANPLYGNTGRQVVYGGYSLSGKQGAGFPNLELNNAAGLLLDDLSDLKIRNNLHFTSGHIFLNGWNLQVGEKTPGSITGYTDKRFIVTGTEVAGGALYRPGINAAADRVVFPVGTAVNSYSPAAIGLTGGTGTFSVRAYDNVYTYATSGPAYLDSFVNKTWHIRREDGNGGETAVVLQHPDETELPAYAAARDSSYITRFAAGGWDKVDFIPATPLAGNLSTGTASVPATMHIRRFTGFGSDEYFSKTTLMANSRPAMFLAFEAYRIAPSLVQLDWTTSREINNAIFEVERRYEREGSFSKIMTLPTKALNGNSSVPLSYTYQDLNEYDDWTYYRIKAVGRNGKVVYSEIRAVPPFVQIDVFPNPNDGHFKVRVRGVRGNLLMQLRDTWSQVMRQYEIKQDLEVAINDLPAGTYFLVLYHKETLKVAYTCKVVVIK